MGKGQGLEINLDFILRVVELILLILAIVLVMIGDDNGFILYHKSDIVEACDAMCIAGSLFIILLVILIGMQLFAGEEQDKKFVGTLSAVGCILLICSGIAVCVLASDARRIVLSGIVGIVAGVALLVGALKDFGVF